MKDYTIEIKVTNNRLMQAMQNREVYTIAALSKATGVSYTTIRNYLNLEKLPLKKSGAFKKSIMLLSEYLHCPPEALFPPQHLHTLLEANTVQTALSFEDFKVTLREIRAPDDIKALQGFVDELSGLLKKMSF